MYTNIEQSGQAPCTQLYIHIATIYKSTSEEEHILAVCLLTLNVGFLKENSGDGLTIFLDFFLTK